jgi:hypothetical protein
VLEHQREERVQEIERRILALVVAQQPDAAGQVEEAPERAGKPVGGECQERRILRLDALPGVDRRAPIA